MWKISDMSLRNKLHHVEICWHACWRRYKHIASKYGFALIRKIGFIEKMSCQRVWNLFGDAVDFINFDE